MIQGLYFKTNVCLLRWEECDSLMTLVDHIDSAEYLRTKNNIIALAWYQLGIWPKLVVNAHQWCIKVNSSDLAIVWISTEINVVLRCWAIISRRLKLLLRIIQFGIFKFEDNSRYYERQSTPFTITKKASRQLKEQKKKKRKKKKVNFRWNKYRLHGLSIKPLVR